MRKWVERLSMCFAGGALGGLANSLVVWAAGVLGVPQALGVSIAPGLTPPFLYQRLVWGGIWGALFLLPLWKSRTWIRATVLSLGPTLVQLLVVFPFKAHKGYFGLDLGTLTPLFVVLYNLVWAFTAAAWLKLSGNR